jgi:hypothetical protein
MDSDRGGPAGIAAVGRRNGVDIEVGKVNSPPLTPLLPPSNPHRRRPICPCGISPVKRTDMHGRKIAAERDDAFAKILAAAPGFSENLANTSRVIPIFELQSASA